MDTGGSTLGVLRSGQGGAIESCREIVDYANQAIDDLGLLVAEIDSGLAPTFIFIAAVGKAAAVAVAEAALSFTDPLVNPSIVKLGLTMVCSALSDFVSNALPSPGGIPKGALSAGAGWMKNTVSGKLVDQLPACQLAEPCTGTAPTQ